MTNTFLPGNIFNRKCRDFLFIAVLAFVVVTVFSACSFLYDFNSWCDVNCIFTVGKSIFCGKIPYKDLMDHKGFLLHLIFGIGSLISFKSFWGLYILELVSGSAFLWACYKTLLLFTDRKVLYLMPFLALATYGSLCFIPGGTAEEFCLPFLSLSFYIGLRSVLKQKVLTLREAFLLGVFASCVFWIKYTICGLFVGLWIGISIFYIQHNLHRQLLKSIGCFCLGLIPVSATIILYFAYNHALSDLWTVYFYNNLFNYSIAVGRHGVFVRLAANELKGLISVISNPLIACMLIGSLVELYLQKDKKILIFSLGCFLSMFVFLFVGSPYRYYPLPIVIGMPFSLLLAMRICKRFTQKWKNVLYLSALLLVMSFGGILIKNRFLMKFEESPVAVRISNLIMKGEEHAPTMIEYNLDMMCLGVYTLCGNVPECKNFCLLNLSIKNQIDAQNNYITTCHPAYIISDKPLSFDGYKCISIQTEHTIPIRNVLHDCLPFIKPIQEPRTKYYVYRYNKSETL